MPRCPNSLRLLTLILGLSINALVSSAQTPPSDWPQFRGPNASGVGDDKPAPAEFGPTKNLLWKTSIPPGASSPCIVAGRIFLTAFDAGKLQTICLSRADGKILWTQVLKPEKVEAYLARRGSPASATPACDGKNLYVYFSSFGVLCYDLA